MKRKILLFGVTMSVLATHAAFAAGEADLTTRGYVDGGLSFVYKKAADADAKADAAQTAAEAADTKAEAVDDRVDALENVVGATESAGLQGAVGTLQGDVGTLKTDVNTLQGTVSQLQAASKTYTSGTGIVVTPGADNNPSTINLNLDNPTNGTSYVFQSNGNGGGTWTALPAITGSWSADDAARIIAPQTEPKSGQESGE